MDTQDSVSFSLHQLHAFLLPSPANIYTTSVINPDTPTEPAPLSVLLSSNSHITFIKTLISRNQADNPKQRNEDDLVLDQSRILSRIDTQMPRLVDKEIISSAFRPDLPLDAIPNSVSHGSHISLTAVTGLLAIATIPSSIDTDIDIDGAPHSEDEADVRSHVSNPGTPGSSSSPSAVRTTHPPSRSTSGSNLSGGSSGGTGSTGANISAGVSGGSVGSGASSSSSGGDGPTNSGGAVHFMIVLWDNLGVDDSDREIPLLPSSSTMQHYPHFHQHNFSYPYSFYDQYPYHLRHSQYYHYHHHHHHHQYRSHHQYPFQYQYQYQPSAKAIHTQTFSLSSSPLFLYHVPAHSSSNDSLFLCSCTDRSIRTFRQTGREQQYIEVSTKEMFPELCQLPAPAIDLDLCEVQGRRTIVVGCQNGYLRISSSRVRSSCIDEETSLDFESEQEHQFEQDPSGSLLNENKTTEINENKEDEDDNNDDEDDEEDLVASESAYLTTAISGLTLFTSRPPPPYSGSESGLSPCNTRHRSIHVRRAIHRVAGIIGTVPLSEEQVPEQQKIEPVNLAVVEAVGRVVVFRDVNQYLLGDAQVLLDVADAKDAGTCVTAADIDGDGKTEIIVGTYNGEVIIFKELFCRNESQFQVHGRHQLGDAVLGIKAVDINDDGVDELVVTTRSAAVILQPSLEPLLETIMNRTSALSSRIEERKQRLAVESREGW